jgi:hypothetical protein
MKLPKRSEAALVVGGSPRADLLPPEIKAAAKARGQRRWLVLIVALTVGAVLAGNVLAWVYATASDVRLQMANEQTASILLEQQKYAEARLLSERVALVGDARIAGLATEIDWKAYLDLVQAALPPGTVISNVAATTAVPSDQSADIEEPLASSSVAGIDFVATTPTIPDVSQWIDNLAGLPGFAGAVPGAITLNDDGTYLVAITMRINELALANRFVPTEGSE